MKASITPQPWNTPYLEQATQLCHLVGQLQWVALPLQAGREWEQETCQRTVRCVHEIMCSQLHGRTVDAALWRTAVHA